MRDVAGGRFLGPEQMVANLRIEPVRTVTRSASPQAVLEEKADG
jgi:hypothetical protein